MMIRAKQGVKSFGSGSCPAALPPLRARKPFRLPPFACAVAVLVACTPSIDELVAKGDAPALAALLPKRCAANGAAPECGELLDGFARLCSNESNGALMNFYRRYARTVATAVRPVLADCKADGAADEFTAEVLNALDTGGDASEILPLLYQLDPGALQRRVDEFTQRGDAARAKASPAVALRHYEDALKLAKLTGKTETLEKSIAQTKAERAPTETRALVDAIIEEVAAGRVVSADALAARLNAPPRCIKTLAPDAVNRLHRIKRIEDQFQVAGMRADGLRQHAAEARATFAAAYKADPKSAEPLRQAYLKAKAEYDTAQGNIVVAARNQDDARVTLTRVRQRFEVIAKTLASQECLK